MRCFTRSITAREQRFLTTHGFTLIELIVVILVLIVLIALFLPPVTRGREAGRRTQCRNNLKQIGLALHHYHDVYGAFPPAYTVDAEGKPLHSWRTLLLPYIDQKPLYDRIDLSKPWDDPANAEVFKARVHGYLCPSIALSSENTVYLAVVTPHSVLRAGSSCTVKDITDGTSSTLAVIEVGTEYAVSWMVPEDADERIIAKFRGTKSKDGHTGGGHALLADGAVRFISENINQQVLLGLTTADGGETVTDF